VNNNLGDWNFYQFTLTPPAKCTYGNYSYTVTVVDNKTGIAQACWQYDFTGKKSFAGYLMASGLMLLLS
jgi:hypothetical protein